MGANTHLQKAKSVGYKTAATATVIVQNIDPLDGYRIAIRAFQATCSIQPATLTFQSAAGQALVDTVAASGAAYVHIDRDPGGTVHPAASADIFCVELDNGKYQYVEASTYFASYAFSCAALEDTVAIGNKVWSLGVYTDTSDNIQVYNLTVSTATANAITNKDADPGLIYGMDSGYPMRVTHTNAGSQAAAIDFISVNYINA